MSVPKEVKIGLLVTIASAIFFTGFYFLKGANLFSTNKEYYCYYANVDGLQNSAGIQIKGLNVGHVAELKLDGAKGVRVILSLNKGIELPKGSVASLASADLLGTKIIRLDIGPGPGDFAPGDVIPTAQEVGMIENVTAALTPRLQELKVTIASLNAALASVDTIMGPQNQAAINAAMNSIKVTADNMAKLTGTLNGESGEMSSIIHNANSITGNLAKENDTVKSILANVNNITGQLSRAPIQKAMTDLQSTTSQLQGIMDKINNNQGTLGMLINNKDAYNNLSNSLQSLNNLMDDLKAHPSRYINVSVFGKKEK